MWSYVEETNARKSLHRQACVHGGASPALLGDVVGHARLEKAVLAALDSVYKAWVPLDLHAVDVARRQLKCRGPKHTFAQPTPPADDATRDAFDRRAAAVALQSGFHTHQATCRKGASGKTGCRMARPAGHPVPETRVLSVTAPKPPLENTEESGASMEPQGGVALRTLLSG